MQTDHEKPDQLRPTFSLGHLIKLTGQIGLVQAMIAPVVRSDLISPMFKPNLIGYLCLSAIPSVLWLTTVWHSLQESVKAAMAVVLQAPHLPGSAHLIDRDGWHRVLITS